MAKNKFDIGVRKNIKKKKDAGFSLAVKTFISAICAIASFLGFFILLLNKDKFLEEEKIDLVLAQIPITPTIMIVLFIVLLLMIAIFLYFSILSLHEYFRRKNNPSDLEKQLELIEKQFTEVEKKTYISSKEKMRQLEANEQALKQHLQEKYGDNPNQK